MSKRAKAKKSGSDGTHRAASTQIRSESSAKRSRSKNRNTNAKHKKSAKSNESSDNGTSSNRSKKSLTIQSPKQQRSHSHNNKTRTSKDRGRPSAQQQSHKASERDSPVLSLPSCIAGDAEEPTSISLINDSNALTDARSPSFQQKYSSHLPSSVRGDDRNFNYYNIPNDVDLDTYIASKVNRSHLSPVKSKTTTTETDAVSANADESQIYQVTFHNKVCGLELIPYDAVTNIGAIVRKCHSTASREQVVPHSFIIAINGTMVSDWSYDTILQCISNNSRPLKIVFHTPIDPNSVRYSIANFQDRNRRTEESKMEHMDDDFDGDYSIPQSLAPNHLFEFDIMKPPPFMKDFLADTDMSDSQAKRASAMNAAGLKKFFAQGWKWEIHHKRFLADVILWYQNHLSTTYHKYKQLYFKTTDLEQFQALNRDAIRSKNEEISIIRKENLGLAGGAQIATQQLELLELKTLRMRGQLESERDQMKQFIGELKKNLAESETKLKDTQMQLLKQETMNRDLKQINSFLTEEITRKRKEETIPVDGTATTGAVAADYTQGGSLQQRKKLVIDANRRPYDGARLRAKTSLHNVHAGGSITPVPSSSGVTAPNSNSKKSNGDDADIDDDDGFPSFADVVIAKRSIKKSRKSSKKKRNGTDSDSGGSHSNKPKSTKAAKMNKNASAKSTAQFRDRSSKPTTDYYHPPLSHVMSDPPSVQTSDLALRTAQSMSTKPSKKKKNKKHKSGNETESDVETIPNAKPKSKAFAERPEYKHRAATEFGNKGGQISLDTEQLDTPTAASIAAQKKRDKKQRRAHSVDVRKVNILKQFASWTTEDRDD